MATFNRGTTPIIIEPLDWVTITSNQNTSGQITIAGEAVTQAIASGQKYNYGGYSAKREIVITINAGSVDVNMSQDGSIPLPTGAVAGAGYDSQGRLLGAGGVVVLDPAAITIADSQPATGPIIVAHRGGPHVEPEHSMSAYKAAYAGGIRFIELDCYRLADGNVGVMHDSTVDRTTDGTGNVTDRTTAQFKALRIDALAANSTAYPLEAPPLFSEVLDWAADRDVVLVVETKHVAAVLPMLRDLDARNFPKSKFIWQSFLEAHFALPLANGWRCMALAADPTAESIQALKNAGFTDIGGAGSNLTEAEVAFAKSIGLKTWSYTADRRVDLAAEAAKGVDYVFCDDPVYVSGAREPLKYAPFSAGRFTPGHLGSGADGMSNRGVFQTDGTWRSGNSASSQYSGSLMGFMCPIGGSAGLPATYTIEAEFTIVAVSAADRWAGIMLNAATDAQFADTSGAAACHHVVIRSSGVFDIYGKLDGVATVLGQRFTGDALTLGTKYKITVTVTPTSITAALDNGATVTFNDARFRGGYFQLGSNGADVKWHSCVVTH